MLLIHGTSVFVRQHVALIGKHGHIWELSIEVLNRVANGLRAAIDFQGNGTGYFGKIGTGCGNATGTIDNVVSLGLANLAKPFTAFDPLLVLVNESIYARVQEPNPLASFGQETTRNQPLISPSRNGLRRHVEHFAKILDGMNRLFGFFYAKVHRIGNVFDEESKIVDRVITFNQTVTGPVRTNLGYPEKEEVVGVVLARIQFAKQ